MGQSLSVLNTTKKTNKDGIIGRSISSDIYKFLIWQFKCPQNKDIISLIIKYIGFRMKSQILNETEQQWLYLCLLKHHRWRHMERSPLLFTNYVTNFELICEQNFYFQPHILTFKYNMLRSCEGKDNLVFVFHSQYDHKFAFFLPRPILAKAPGQFYKIVHPDVPLFLLKVCNNNETNKKPRILPLLDRDWASFDDRYPVDLLHIGNLCLHPFGSAIYEKVYNIDVEEQLGGTKNLGFLFKRIEVFQLW